MAALVPRGYGGFPPYQFMPPNQFNTRYYNGGYPRQGALFAPHYPTQPLYQPPFNPVNQNLAPVANQFRKPGVTTELVALFNELDAQYRYEQYLRQRKKMEKEYWKQQINTLPPTLFFSPAPLYQYEKETKYIPYPVYIGPGAGAGGYGAGAGGYGAGRYLGGSGMDLPPKIRVIFLPTGQSFSQQPYTGSLAMPPFLYNRISQPLCSFPLPPPLPQIGSLPLTPAVQQMVIQRYSNPVAVLPFSANWQIPQLMMPSYSSFPQQQQQYIQSASAVPALPPPLQSYICPPPAPQACIPPTILSPPSAPISAFASAPQIYIPPPPPPVSMSIPSSFPPAPQVYIPPPAPQVYIPPPAPQVYIPPPPSNSSTSSTAVSSDSQVYIPPPPPMLSLPSTNANLVSSLPQYPYSGYPSICRACPPEPPPLNIAVTGHCWVQHCSACHHVPTPISNPNVRPVGARMTPLLRQPIVPQYIPEQTRQEHFHTNAPVIMRPWLRKTPPLPPGAVVISDEYITKNGSYPRYNHPPRQHRQHQRSSRDKYRSTTVTSRSNPAANLPLIKNNRSVSPRKFNNNNKPIQQQEFAKVKNSTATISTSTSSSGLSGEYEKITLHSSETKLKAIPQILTREARNVNLQYKYQPEELPTVYLVNNYLKSSSEASTLTSNIKTPPDCSPPFIKEHNPLSSSASSSSLSSSIRLNSIKSKPKYEKEDAKPVRPPSHSKKSQEKIIIIREFMTSSPSTISSISSNMMFSIINKDEDSISTTSTLKADN